MDVRYRYAIEGGWLQSPRDSDSKSGIYCSLRKIEEKRRVLGQITVGSSFFLSDDCCYLSQEISSILLHLPNPRSGQLGSFQGLNNLEIRIGINEGGNGIVYVGLKIVVCLLRRPGECSIAAKAGSYHDVEKRCNAELSSLTGADTASSQQNRS